MQKQQYILRVWHKKKQLHTCTTVDRIWSRMRGEIPQIRVVDHLNKTAIFHFNSFISCLEQQRTVSSQRPTNILTIHQQYYYYHLLPRGSGGPSSGNAVMQSSIRLTYNQRQIYDLPFLKLRIRIIYGRHLTFNMDLCIFGFNYCILPSLSLVFY